MSSLPDDRNTNETGLAPSYYQQRLNGQRDKTVGVLSLQGLLLITWQRSDAYNGLVISQDRAMGLGEY